MAFASSVPVMRSDFRCFLLMGAIGKPGTATISEIHWAVDVENLLHDSLRMREQAARPSLNQAG
jgi:hypothetical protein